MYALSWDTSSATHNHSGLMNLWYTRYNNICYMQYWNEWERRLSRMRDVGRSMQVPCHLLLDSLLPYFICTDGTGPRVRDSMLLRLRRERSSWSFNLYYTVFFFHFDNTGISESKKKMKRQCFTTNEFQITLIRRFHCVGIYPFYYIYWKVH